MQKKLLKYDVLFLVSMLLVLIMHLSCIFGAEHFADESFYPTVPLRLINGESLVSNEWHLTQFSSLFLYIPVKIWLTVTGSTEGIILFLRFFYLIIHTIAGLGIYAFFRKYKLWAIAGAVIFYSQVPLRFMNANYHSLLALFLLLFTLCLISIYKSEKFPLYLIAGFCYGCCCVCNPFECLLFVVYIIACVIWLIQSSHYKKKPSDNTVSLQQKIETLNKFFSVGAFLKFTSGLLIAAIISIVFFLATGGTIDALFENLPYLLNDSGHDIFSSPLEAFIEKIQLTATHINGISFGLPWLLPLFYLVLLFDKKRKNNKHKIFFLTLSLVLTIFFTIGISIETMNNSRRFAIALPFAIISTTCYILTEKKNKKLFYCMWLPSALANVIQYLASDLHLSTMWVLTIGNIAGVFFLNDFIAELKPQETDNKKKSGFSVKYAQTVFCICICLQVFFQGFIYTAGRTVDMNNYAPLTKGPYKNIYLDNDDYNRNLSIMKDLDYIKKQTNSNDHICILSEFSWMYLYIDRPFGTYSAWMPFLELERLETYYSMNPDKTPAYIYVGWVYIPTGISKEYKINQNRASADVEKILEVFDCQVEELGNGYLLKVNSYKSDNAE